MAKSAHNIRTVTLVTSATALLGVIAGLLSAGSLQSMVSFGIGETVFGLAVFVAALLCGAVGNARVARSALLVAFIVVGPLWATWLTPSLVVPLRVENQSDAAFEVIVLRHGDQRFDQRTVPPGGEVRITLWAGDGPFPHENFRVVLMNAADNNELKRISLPSDLIRKQLVIAGNQELGHSFDFVPIPATTASPPPASAP